VVNGIREMENTEAARPARQVWRFNKKRQRVVHFASLTVAADAGRSASLSRRCSARGQTRTHKKAIM